MRSLLLEGRAWRASFLALLVVVVVAKLAHLADAVLLTAVALQFVVWGAELSRVYRARNSTIRAALGTLRYPHPSDPEVRSRLNVVPSRVALAAASSDPDCPPGDNGLPPYIARDIDPELRHHLNDALVPVGDASRRWLLIEGPPHAGATRTAYEALRAVGRDNPGLRVLIPGRDAGAARLLSDYLNLRVPDRQRDPCVLVLDALDRFLQPVAIPPLDRLAALAESSPPFAIFATIRAGVPVSLGPATELRDRFDQEFFLGDTTPSSYDTEQAARCYPGVDFSASGIGAYFAAEEAPRWQ